MFAQRKWSLVGLILVVVILSAGIGRTEADGPPSSEPETAIADGAATNSGIDPEVAELQTAAGQPASAGVDSEGNPAPSDGPSKGQMDPVEETLTPEEQQAPAATYFKRYPGVAFQPRDSDTGYDYFGSGCISSQGADYFVLDIQLPAGAEIDFVRLYYYDASSANARLYLTWYDAQGGYSDVVYVDSSGSSGYGSAGIATSYTVDPITQAVTLVWRPNTTGSSMALCGARIRYQVSAGAAYMPYILRDGTG
jgi:hypothetical protein